MTLFDYYARYMTELWEGKRPAPEGITLPEDGDEKARIQSLAQQLQAMGMAEFVRACAAQDGTLTLKAGVLQMKVKADEVRLIEAAERAANQ